MYTHAFELLLAYTHPYHTMASLDDDFTANADGLMPSMSAANVEFGKDYTKICVRNIDDLPAVMNDIVQAKRKMLEDEAKLVQAKANAESNVFREQQGNSSQQSTGHGQPEDEEAMQTSPRSKRKIDCEHENNSIGRAKRPVILNERGGRNLLNTNDRLRSLGWKTIACGMCDHTINNQEEFPGSSFLKNSLLGNQCPRGEMFHLLPETYSMADDRGVTYKYARCACTVKSSFTEKPSYSATVRLVRPAHQEDTPLKCYLVQVATKDFDQIYGQHDGDDGTAHIVPGGEFAVERLRTDS